MKSFSQLLLASLLGATLAIVGFKFIPKSHNQEIQVNPVSSTRSFESFAPAGLVDFKAAAAKAMPAVVHIKASESNQTARERVERERLNRGFDPFTLFFGEGFLGNSSLRKQVGYGSGVIISRDGVIVTNNHVVDFADDLEVTLHDNRTFTARLIGRDPKSDVALIKMDGHNFDYLEFANSDLVQVGEWVAAVGNPFELTSTVTAGIISAKGRSNILREQDAEEDFIQTDAVVNPGNSGGALVDAQGNLIGINTAIATPTEVYAGYAFAIPSNLVKKKIEEIKIQADKDKTDHGYVGLELNKLTEELIQKYRIRANEGLLVMGIDKDAPAYYAGLSPGDVIIKIDDKKVLTVEEYNRQMNKYYVGDKPEFTVVRDGYIYTIPVKITRSLDR